MKVSLERAKDLYKAGEDTISLSTPIGEDEDAELGDFIPADNQSPDDIVLNGLLRGYLEDIISSLKISKREEYILRLRYGFIDGEEHTLDSIGKELGITRERIRQLEAKALNKLRMNSKTKELAVYTDDEEKSLKRLQEYKNASGNFLSKNKNFMQGFRKTPKEDKPKTLTKEDYLKVMELLKTPLFANLATALPVNEAIIVCLKLGFIENKKYTTDQIAEFLKMDKEEVTKIISKALLNYKDILDEIRKKTNTSILKKTRKRTD